MLTPVTEIKLPGKKKPPDWTVELIGLLGLNYSDPAPTPECNRTSRGTHAGEEVRPVNISSTVGNKT